MIYMTELYKCWFNGSIVHVHVDSGQRMNENNNNNNNRLKKKRKRKKCSHKSLIHNKMLDLIASIRFHKLEFIY